MKKITMTIGNTIAETFEDFLISRKAKGVTEKKIVTYQHHFKAISRHLDKDIPIVEITKNDLEGMISSMRSAELAPNTIRSYTRTLKAFLTWCNNEELTDVNMQSYKGEETIKETYSDKELEKLLQKPNIRKCNFSEYRTWVIVNLLINNGCRAATVRNIKNKDIDLDNLVIYLRHTKSRKSQVIPLCTELCGILKEYMRIRGGAEDDYLFSNESGAQLKEYGLRSSIARYNKRHGVSKTSIHTFRHTFARKYFATSFGSLHLRYDKNLLRNI